MNTGVEAMRRNVETTVNSVLRGLQIAQKDIERQASKFESRISDVPKQEKEFMTISRHMARNQGDFIYHAVAEAGGKCDHIGNTANNGRIVEEPLPKDPVAPKKLVFYWLRLWWACLFRWESSLSELLKYKIENRGDGAGDECSDFGRIALVWS